MKAIKCIAVGGGLTLALLCFGGSSSSGAQPTLPPVSLAPTTPPAPSPTPPSPPPHPQPSVPCNNIPGGPPTKVPVPTKTIIIKEERVRVVKVPVTTTIVKEVPTPVPGPTKTLYTDRFSPGQTKVIHDKIRAAVLRTSLWAIAIAILVGLISLVVVYSSGYRLGEVNDAKKIRGTIKRS